MRAAELLDQLRRAGIRLGLRGGKLRYIAEPGRMTLSLRRRIRESRAQILQELAGTSRGDTWLLAAEAEFRRTGRRVGLDLGAEEIQARLEALEERAAILEFDAGLEREQAERRAIEMAVAELEGRLESVPTTEARRHA